jgi:hypothetical protein
MKSFREMVENEFKKKKRQENDFTLQKEKLLKSFDEVKLE